MSATGSPRRTPAPAGSVLMVHGAGGGGWEWRAWARSLGTRGFDVHAPDLAPSPDGLAATGFEDYRGQVVRYGRALAPPLVLAGASLGGLLVLAAADLGAAARVLVNPVPPAGTAGWSPRRREWPPVVPWGDEADFESTRRAMPDCGHAARVMAHRRWRNESGRVLTEAHHGVDVAPDAVPTLVLASERDRDVPAAASRELAARYGWDLVAVSGASHLGPLLGHSAAACARIASAWLDLHLPAAPGRSAPVQL